MAAGASQTLVGGAAGGALERGVGCPRRGELRKGCTVGKIEVGQSRDLRGIERLLSQGLGGKADHDGRQHEDNAAKAVHLPQVVGMSERTCPDGRHRVDWRDLERNQIFAGPERPFFVAPAAGAPDLFFGPSSSRLSLPTPPNDVSIQLVVDRAVYSGGKGH